MRNIVAKHNPHVVILNEVKVKPSGTNKYNIEGYTKISDNKTNWAARGRGIRGTFMYIHNDLFWCRGKPCENLECCSILLNLEGGPKIIINGLYAPPGENNVNEDIENLLNVPNSISVGDWNGQHPAFGHINTDPRRRLLYEYISNGLIDIAMDPRGSRPTARVCNTNLDYALTNIANNITTCENITDVGSDHVPILVKIRLAPITAKNGRTRLKTPEEWLEYENKTKLEKQPNIHTHTVVENAIQHLTSHLQSTVRAMTRRIKKSSELLPEEIQQSIRERNRVRYAIRRNNRINDRTWTERFAELKARVAYQIREHKQERWLRVIEEETDNRKAMWKIQKSLKRPENRVPYFEGANTQKEIAAILIDAAIIHESNVNENIKTTAIQAPPKPLQTTNGQEMRKALKKFKNNKAPGPDKLSAKHLKRMHESCFNRIKEIFNYCLTHNYYPNAWKLGTCIFLHKHGKPVNEPTSYRPITLLNIMGKWFERIIQNRMGACFVILPDSQHGFRQGLGTASQLTRTTHFIQKSINEGKTCHAVSLDLSKAFDCINHNALTYKLLEKNIDISIVKLVESYLSNRKVQGKFLNEICDPVHQAYGVP